MGTFRAAGLLAILGLLAGCRAAETPPEAAGTVVSLDGIGYDIGLVTAPVTVVEFSDFGCPYCAAFASDTYPTLHAEFVLSGRVRWIFVPFVLGMFPNGDVAALVAECAGDQGRFWPMHDLLYQHQPEWRREGGAGETFLRLAERAGADPEELEACVLENRPRVRIDRQNRVGRRLGIRATPTFIIDGRMVEGALPADQFRGMLEVALAAGDQRAAVR